MSVNSKMIAIADEVRTLSGTTETMGLDAMATNIGAANTEIGGQTDLIAQIASALEGKAAGGGSNTSVKTCRVDITLTNASFLSLPFFYTTLDADGNLIYTSSDLFGYSTISVIVVCNTLCIFNNSTHTIASCVTNGGVTKELDFSNNGIQVFKCNGESNSASIIMTGDVSVDPA